MLNSKQRAQLRAMANGADTILQVGKGGIGENVIRQASDALTARELIKGRVLEASGMTATEASDEIARVCGAETVFTIGSKFVIFKQNTKLPREKRIKLVK